MHGGAAAWARAAAAGDPPPPRLPLPAAPQLLTPPTNQSTCLVDFQVHTSDCVRVCHQASVHQAQACCFALGMHAGKQAGRQRVSLSLFVFCRDNRLVQPWAAAVAQMLTQLPQSTAESTVFSSGVYWLSGLTREPGPYFTCAMLPSQELPCRPPRPSSFTHNAAPPADILWLYGAAAMPWLASSGELCLPKASLAVSLPACPVVGRF